MRNHEYVPYEVILKIGNLRSGETYKIVRKLLKNKLVVHIGGKSKLFNIKFFIGQWMDFSLKLF